MPWSMPLVKSPATKVLQGLYGHTMNTTTLGEFPQPIVTMMGIVAYNTSTYG